MYMESTKHGLHPLSILSADNLCKQFGPRSDILVLVVSVDSVCKQFGPRSGILEQVLSADSVC